MRSCLTPAVETNSGTLQIVGGTQRAARGGTAQALKDTT